MRFGVNEVPPLFHASLLDMGCLVYLFVGVWWLLLYGLRKGE